MKKRLLAGLLSMALMVTAFTGCGKDSSSDSKDTDNASGDKPIEVRVTRWGGDEVKAEKQLVEEFNTNNDKNIKIIYDLVPGDGYGDRLTTSFSSGDGYDVFLSGEGDFFKWVDKGLTYPMDDLIANDKEYTQAVSDSLLDMGKIDGKQHYMTAGANSIALFYNKDMFDKAGMEYPNDNWTWDDLFEAAKKLTVKNEDGTYEAYGFNAQNWSYAVLSYLESLGLNFMNEDATVTDGYMNSPEVAKALEAYFAMAEEPNKVSPATADFKTFGSATAMMTERKLAMFVSGAWDVTPLREAGTNYGTALIPGNHTSYICAAGFAIGKNTKNPEAAWEVIKLLTDEKSSKLREELEKSLPASQEGMDEYLKTQDERDHALVRTLDYGVQPIGLKSKLGSSINEITNNIFERIIFKDAAAQQVLDDAVKEVTK